MLIKKKQYTAKAWPHRPVKSENYHDDDDYWPPAPYHDDDSGCSFSSAPSFSDEDDEDDVDKNGNGEKDMKQPSQEQTEQPQRSNYFVHMMMPTTTVESIHDAASPSRDGATPNGYNRRPSHETDNNKDDKAIAYNNNNNNNNNNNDHNNVTSDLFQIGSMVVVGLIGFLVVFAVGVAVGEHHHQQDHDREDHYYYHWEKAPRRLAGHRHFREW